MRSNVYHEIGARERTGRSPGHGFPLDCDPSHESRARREAVGRPRAGRRSSAPRARRDGYFEGRGYQVTWALGHLATLKEPQDYDPALKRWSLATLPVRPRAVRAQADRRRGGRASSSRSSSRLFRAADELICATDAGREGELIFRYILELTGCDGQAGPAALAQLADRGGDPRRLRAGSGRCPTTTPSTPRPGAGARPTGSSA